jgi:hypothetical protein
MASRPKQVARMRNLNHLTPAEAVRVVKLKDRPRGLYLKTHFHVCIDDDLFYHLIINTDRIPYPDAARLITEETRSSFRGGMGSGEETKS